MYTLFTRGLIPIFTFLLLCHISALGQSNHQQLDDYVAIAFTQNQGLKEQQFDLDKAMAALKEAQAMYLPTVSLLGSYTRSAGGRTIDVPVGDLVNPVYSALNQLTNSNKFPQLKNESFLLNPNNFYDAKLRTSLPLINAEIRYNKLIKQQLITSQQAAVNVYKRALVKDIKTAYYRYYQSLQSIATYNSAMLLIKENIRENESMLRNGIRNGTALLRSQTEQEKNKSALIQAQHNMKNAKSYFNFLLNRSLQDSILIEKETIADIITAPDTSFGTSRREEIKQLRTMQHVYTLDYQLQKSGFIPKVNTFVDLGSQGFDFNINNKTRYYLWGVNLQWDIFTGGQRKHRAEQSRANVNATIAQLDQTEQSLQLQLDQTYNNYQSATAAYKSITAQLLFASKYYNDQLKAYRAGQLLYLELVDAQDQLTNARLQMADAEANVQIALAELEREQATYPINNPNQK
ncbi:TolC family protein [Mucilaginibacter lappiensis]|uniref:Outer membrane protein TolC n=1 Tax=Mucilaginibacter lappiensis TaxID=354630 RepID=A0A841J5G7_9SPHI|nr:TolC family protein [Mucilaginibacter lappiensis]MBB6126034.1 outer membrane protein TolC [Mucilaginibacter lappiensis]